MSRTRVASSLAATWWLLALLTPVDARAQMATHEFGDLERPPHQGQVVIVTDREGLDTTSRIAGVPPSAGALRTPDLGGVIRLAIAREADRLAPSRLTSRDHPQEAERAKRSWIGRHPVLFGSAVGFGAGFLIGYVPGDDGVFEDFTATSSGLMLGAAGAGAGALTGALVGGFR